MDIRDEITIPAQEARHGDAQAWPDRKSRLACGEGPVSGHEMPGFPSYRTA